MTPFENLMQELSTLMEVALQPDTHESCLILFSQDELSIQIDLDTHADKILIGTQLGRVTPGPYRERIFSHALQDNGSSQFPKGILAFSEKNDTIVLFQFLTLLTLNGEKLYGFLQLFRERAKLWKRALSTGDIPKFDEGQQSSDNRMFGLKP